MPRFQQHLARRAAARRTSESGLALLDVLLGMAIFALIAVIAVQGNRYVRERAYETQTAADLKNVSLLLSARIAQDELLPPATSSGTPMRSYPNWDGVATVASWDNLSGIENMKLTNGVEVARYGVYPDGKSWHMCMVHRTNGVIDAWAAWHSPSGKIYQSGRGSVSSLPASTSCNSSML